MTVKEQIIKKIEKIDENRLSNLYKIVEEFESKTETNALAKLRKIKISASPDFSTRATLYIFVGKSGFIVLDS